MKIIEERVNELENRPKETVSNCERKEGGGTEQGGEERGDRRRGIEGDRERCQGGRETENEKKNIPSHACGTIAKGLIYMQQESEEEE